MIFFFTLKERSFCSSCFYLLAYPSPSNKRLHHKKISFPRSSLVEFIVVDILLCERFIVKKKEKKKEEIHCKEYLGYYLVVPFFWRKDRWNVK